MKSSMKEVTFELCEQIVAKFFFIWVNWTLLLVQCVDRRLNEIRPYINADKSIVEFRMYGQSVDIKFPIIFAKLLYSNRMIRQKRENRSWKEKRKDQKFMATVKIIRQPKCWHVKTPQVKSSIRKKNQRTQRKKMTETKAKSRGDRKWLKSLNAYERHFDSIQNEVKRETSIQHQPGKRKHKYRQNIKTFSHIHCRLENWLWNVFDIDTFLLK